MFSNRLQMLSMIPIPFEIILKFFPSVFKIMARYFSSDASGIIVPCTFNPITQGGVDFIPRQGGGILEIKEGLVLGPMLLNIRGDFLSHNIFLLQLDKIWINDPLKSVLDKCYTNK